MRTPSRMELRRWLTTLELSDIKLLLDHHQTIHGKDQTDDLRYHLRNDADSDKAHSPAEASMVSMSETHELIEKLRTGRL